MTVNCPQCLWLPVLAGVRIGDALHPSKSYAQMKNLSKNLEKLAIRTVNRGFCLLMFGLKYARLGSPMLLL